MKLQVSTYLTRLIYIILGLVISFFILTFLSNYYIESPTRKEKEKKLNQEEKEEKPQSLSETSDIDEVLTCNICLEKYSLLNKPLLLFCGHTFCNTCLLHLQESTRLKCPLCRRITDIPKEGLVTNYSLAHLISKEKEKIKIKNICVNILKDIQQDTISAKGRNSDQINSSFIAQFRQYLNKIEHILEKIIEIK